MIVHAVMKHWDPMLGMDFHMGYSPIATPPPLAPVPTGPYPFATMQFTSGLYIFFKPLWKQVTFYGVSVEKGTDIGSGIPHIPLMPPIGIIVELPAIIAFSGSKSHFYSATYKVTDKNPALGIAGFTNLNLNCGMPFPTPTGVAFCITTHVAGMSWGDVLAGAGSMLGDIAIQTVLNLLGLKFGNRFGVWFAGKVGASATGFVAGQAANILAFIFGTPVGGSSSNIGSFIVDQDGNAWNPGSAVGWGPALLENAGRALGNYFDGNPPNFQVPSVSYPAGVNWPTVSNVTNNAPPL